MRDTICLECRARVDRCWRWCPECGSVALCGPQGEVVAARWRDDDFAVEWELDVDGFGPSGDQPVGSPA